MFIVASLALLSWFPAHSADESEAEACLRTKVWDGYADGWGIRTMTNTTLETGKTRNYLVTLYQGNEYKIATCGESAVKNFDVLLYDTEGNVSVRDKTSDREPVIEYTPKETGTFYVVLYLRDVEGKSEADLAMAVVYR